MSEIPDQEAWNAWHPRELAERLAGIDRPWCVVGGWALDLWHGRETREHHDLEFTVLREDFDTFRRALTETQLPLIPLPGPSPRSDGEKADGAPTLPRMPSPRLRGEGSEGRMRMRGESAAGPNFAFYTVNSGTFQHLPDNAVPHPSIGQIWCWDIAANCWRVDIMIEPGTRNTWVCKRDHAITLPRTEAVRRSVDGIPYLDPAAILLLKAKHQRPKDEADFATVLPTLSPPQRAWLRDGLARLHPGHGWFSLI